MGHTRIHIALNFCGLNKSGLMCHIYIYYPKLLNFLNIEIMESNKQLDNYPSFFLPDRASLALCFHERIDMKDKVEHNINQDCKRYSSVMERVRRYIACTSHR